MLLTILIPTRNRANRVVPLVAYLLANWPDDDRTQTEIVVLNNASEDRTKEKLEKFSDPMLRVITNQEFIPTSEENIFNGIKYARGDFVWFLGDDDLPRYEGVRRLVGLLKQDKADLFIFNFRVVDGEGRLATQGQIRGIGSEEPTSLASIIRRVGMINMLSGWSILAARRSMLDTEIAHTIRSVSPIYSHCFWFLHCFASARTQLIAQPLVDYRIFHQHGGWESYTKEKQVGYFHYWHLGLLRLFEHAIKGNKLSYRDVSQVFEYRHNGTRYRAIDEIVSKLIEQSDAYVRTGLVRNLLSIEEFDEAASIILKIDFKLQDVLVRVKSMYRLLWRSEEFSDFFYDAYRALRVIAVELLENRQKDLFEPYFIVLNFGYMIYRIDNQWIAIRHDTMHLQDSIFAQVDCRPLPPDVFRGDSYDDLIAQLAEAKPVAEPVGSQSALVIPYTETRGAKPRSGDEEILNDVPELGISVLPTKSFHPGRALAKAFFQKQVTPPSYFDTKWYLSKYSDVVASGVDPYRHFVNHGLAEGRNPNEMFDNDWYVLTNDDVRAAGYPAFQHFLQYGIREKRSPHPKYSLTQFIDRYMQS